MRRGFPRITARFALVLVLALASFVRLAELPRFLSH
jgi:hypothetical protein